MTSESPFPIREGAFCLRGTAASMCPEAEEKRRRRTGVFRIDDHAKGSRSVARDCGSAHDKSVPVRQLYARASEQICRDRQSCSPVWRRLRAGQCLRTTLSSLAMRSRRPTRPRCRFHTKSRMVRLRPITITVSPETGVLILLDRHPLHYSLHRRGCHPPGANSPSASRNGPRNRS